MTDATFTDAPAAGTSAGTKPKRRDIGLKGRYAAERRFRAYGLIAIALGLLFLVL
ncbi:MAG: DUF3333 domain-containing protein, partial [Pseudomonadota bacterium]